MVALVIGVTFGLVLGIFFGVVIVLNALDTRG